MGGFDSKMFRDTYLKEDDEPEYMESVDRSHQAMQGLHADDMIYSSKTG